MSESNGNGGPPYGSLVWLLRWARENHGHQLGAPEHRLLLVLSTYGGYKSVGDAPEAYVAWPAIESLAKACMCAQGTVYKALKVLEAHALIRRSRHPRLSVNLYTFVVDAAPAHCDACAAATAAKRRPGRLNGTRHGRRRPSGAPEGDAAVASPSSPPEWAVSGAPYRPASRRPEGPRSGAPNGPASGTAHREPPPDHQADLQLEHQDERHSPPDPPQAGGTSSRADVESKEAVRAYARRWALRTIPSAPVEEVVNAYVAIIDEDAAWPTTDGVLQRLAQQAEAAT